ncbi:MAG: glycosyl transferase family 1 [Candidatus Omnitrophica bacterium 4484_70.1]|nr:MAG: glycosyl transferase family 1 [Candidatus Omnitrophica bacterium 4484_70.1]
MPRIDDYRVIVGNEIIDELYLLAEKLKGVSIQNINSTPFGGGVAEILSRMVPLMQQLGVNVWWDVIEGEENFFFITKKIHNRLHGVDVPLSKKELDYFLEINHQNALRIKKWADVIFVHDPQPIALVRMKKKLRNRWVWRCHIDFSSPCRDVWIFLKKFIEKYDVSVFSAPIFSRNLSIRQVLIFPSIDPLSDKNKELEEDFIEKVLNRFGIDKEKPIITQISRFDYLKDPIGVIRAYQMVKKYIDCQLVLAGGGALDDPEGEKVLEEVKNEAASSKDIFVLHLPPNSHLEINALQRASTIILQKSLREGFGLTVAEALWKEKPVIASCVGGIPLQIAHKYSGILTYTIEGTAHWIRRLLHEPEYARRLARNGKEHVKNNFLITRHLQNYLLLFLSLYNFEDLIYLD